MARVTRHGFTLIETIAAVVLLAVGIAPMLWMLHEAHIQRVDPVLASRARWLASEMLEDVIADGHSESRGYDYLNNGHYPQEASVAGFNGFSRSVDIEETGPDLASPGNGYKKIEVTVSWNGSQGKSHEFTLAGVMTEQTP